MLLAIDVGNTNIVMGLYRLGDEGAPAQMMANWRITTPPKQTADEFGCDGCESVRAGGQGDRVGGWGGDFVGGAAAGLDAAAGVRGAISMSKPLFIEPGVRTGLPVLTDNPAEVGADRIVNCVAAFERFGRRAD